MQNIIGIGTIIILSVINFHVVDYFSTSRALILTAMGLTVSFGWYLGFSQIFENENMIDGIDKRFSFIDYVFCTGPSFVFYLVIWLVSGVIYVSA